MPKWPNRNGRTRCEIHGYDCPGDANPAPALYSVSLHSHSVAEPKKFYCDQACTIGECGEYASTTQNHLPFGRLPMPRKETTR